MRVFPACISLGLSAVKVYDLHHGEPANDFSLLMD